MRVIVATAGAALVVGFAAGWFVRAPSGGRGGAGAPHGAGAAAEAAGRAAERAAGESRSVASASARVGGPAAGGAAGGTVPPSTSGAAGPSNTPASCAQTLVLAAQQARRIAALERDLRDAQAKLAHSTPQGGGADAPVDGETAAERRAAAARRGELLLELPQLGDGIGLSDETATKLGLSADQRAAIDKMYRDFYGHAMDELRELLRGLTGDPHAGESSSLDALVQDVVGLSPPGLCRARMAQALALLAAGEPLAPPGPDAPACEIAIYFLFGSVDQMEQQAAALGDTAHEALWSGRSSFRFSNGSGPDE